jgi:hypothetical protein
MNLNPFVNYNEDSECTTSGELEPEVNVAAVDQAFGLILAEDLEKAARVRDAMKRQSDVRFRRLGIQPAAEPERRLADGLDFEFLVDLADRRGRSFGFALVECRRFLERAKVKKL